MLPSHQPAEVEPLLLLFVGTISVSDCGIGKIKSPPCVGTGEPSIEWCEELVLLLMSEAEDTEPV